MPVKKITQSKSANEKRNIVKAIREQLQNVLLPMLKEKLSEKKFEKRIKKAAKILGAGISKTVIKNPADFSRKISTVTKRNTKVASKK